MLRISVLNPFFFLAILVVAVAANADNTEDFTLIEKSPVVKPAPAALETASEAAPPAALPELAKEIVTTDDCFENIPEGKSCERSLCLSRAVGEAENVIAESYSLCLAANNANRGTGSDRAPANKEKECSH